MQPSLKSFDFEDGCILLFQKDDKRKEKVYLH